MAHYKAASGGDGNVANAAQANLVRLDIGANPGSYVSRRCDAGSNGNLVVSVRNDAGATLSRVVLGVTYADSQGRARSEQRVITRRIAAGEIASIDTGIGPYAAGAGCPVTVVAAELAGQ